MSDLLAKEYRTWGDRYEVSSDGYIRSAVATPAGPKGRYLLPYATAKCAIYSLVYAAGESVRKMPVSKIVSAAWGVPDTSTYLARIEVMREAISEHNRVAFPEMHKADEKRRLGYNRIVGALGTRNSGEEAMPCPWASGKITDRDLLGADIMLGFAL